MLNVQPANIQRLANGDIQKQLIHENSMLGRAALTGRQRCPAKGYKPALRDLSNARARMHAARH
jgi:hypothetical protein